MEKPTKEEQISFVKDLFTRAESLVLANIEGLNASEITTLRKELKLANVGFKVVKNKLARKALENTEAKVLFNDFIGSTAVAWSDTDPVIPAKLLVKFEKDIEKLQLKAGFNSAKRLDISSIKSLAQLPNLSELHSQLLGLFNAPSSKLLAQIQAVSSHIVGVLQAKIDKDKE